MAIYRNVQLSFWTDNKVEDEFTPEDKYFYLYLLTNPQTNICGCYEASWSQLTNQTGYNKDTVIRLLDRFENIHKVIKFNKETKEILILHWYKYNWSKSEKTLTGVTNVALHIKSTEFKMYILELIEKVRKGKENIAPCMPHVYPMQASVSDTDSVSDINNTNNNTSINNKYSFDAEKAWNDTFDKYPKKSAAVMAKQRWMEMLVDTPEPNRKDVAVLIFNAIKLYLLDYEKNNPDDKDFRYIPKLHTWFEQDCGYWITKAEVWQREANGDA